MDLPKTWEGLLSFFVPRTLWPEVLRRPSDPFGYEPPRPYIPKSPKLELALTSVFYRQDEGLIDRLVHGLRDWLQDRDLLDKPIERTPELDRLTAQTWHDQSIPYLRATARDVQGACRSVASELSCQLRSEKNLGRLWRSGIREHGMFAGFPASVPGDVLDLFYAHPPGPTTDAIRCFLRLCEDWDRREFSYSGSGTTFTFAQHVVVNDRLEGLLVSPPVSIAPDPDVEESGPVIASLVALALDSHPDFNVPPPPSDLCLPPTCSPAPGPEARLHATIPKKWYSCTAKLSGCDPDEISVLDLLLHPDPLRLTFRKDGRPVLHHDIVPLSIHVPWHDPPPPSPPPRCQLRAQLRARKVEVDLRKTFLSDWRDFSDDDDDDDDDDRTGAQDDGCGGRLECLPRWAQWTYRLPRAAITTMAFPILVDAYLRRPMEDEPQYFPEPVRVPGPYPDPDGRSELVLDDERIGSGNSGDVWRGQLVSTDAVTGQKSSRPVIWKVGEWERIDFIARESLTYSAVLSHCPDLPVPKYIGTCAAADCSWIGILLEDSGGTRSGSSGGHFWAHARPIRKAILKAIEDLHGAGICQSSFRPDNVIILGAPFPLAPPEWYDQIRSGAVRFGDRRPVFPAADEADDGRHASAPPEPVDAHSLIGQTSPAASDSTRLVQNGIEATSPATDQADSDAHRSASNPTSQVAHHSDDAQEPATELSTSLDQMSQTMELAAQSLARLAHGIVPEDKAIGDAPQSDARQVQDRSIEVVAGDGGGATVGEEPEHTTSQGDGEGEDRAETGPNGCDVDEQAGPPEDQARQAPDGPTEQDQQISDDADPKATSDEVEKALQFYRRGDGWAFGEEFDRQGLPGPFAVEIIDFGRAHLRVCSRACECIEPAYPELSA